jgi:integrase
MASRVSQSVATAQERPLFDAVQAWFDAIPGSQQGITRSAMKMAFGERASDWKALSLKRYRRNELRLAAGVLREDARAKVRAAATGPRERALIECCWVLRRGEIAALRWGELDLPRGMITVRSGRVPQAAPQDVTGLMRLMRHENVATTQRYIWLELDDLAPRMAVLEL